MPALGVHDPLALVGVSDAEILAKRDALAEQDIPLQPSETIRCSVAELFRLRQIIDTWDMNGASVLPFETVEGAVYYFDKGFFESLYTSIVVLKNSRYARLYNYAKTLLDINAGGGFATQRDMQDKRWPQWDSNIYFAAGATFTFAQWSAARKHADIAISGTYNETAATANGALVTVVADQPVYRASYWEFDVTGNSGELYVGLINSVKAVSGSYALGSDAESIGVRVDGAVVKDAIEGGVVTPLTDMDAASGVAPVPTPPDYNAFVQNRVALRYDPHTGKLEVAVQEDAVPFGNEWQVVATGLNVRLGGVGQIFPAVSIKSGNAIKLVSRTVDLGNYGTGDTCANVLLNMARGLFVLDESA